METVVKQGVGIDISKKDFSVCVSFKLSDGEVRLTEVVKFDNNNNGFNKLVSWVSKKTNKKLPTYYAMEATGVYHEGLAYHLNKIKKQVSIILPSKVKFFAKSFNERTKTDVEDARIIARMVAERKLGVWTPPKKAYIVLRELSRFRSVLVDDSTRYKNHLEALTHSVDTPIGLIKRTNKFIDELKKAVESTEKEMKEIVEKDERLRKGVQNVCTIPGVGFITAITVISETLGFELFTNRKQLASYAGFDVVERQSGTSVKGKTRISKKGNARIRKGLYMPTLSAIQFAPDLKEDYERINKDRPKNEKKVGVTAIARKLLLLIYTLWKNDDTYRCPIQTSGNIEL